MTHNLFTLFKRVAYAVVIITLLLFGFFKLIKSRSFQLFGNIISHVNTNEKVVAITFDDGPSEYTDSVISILEKENVKASFFLIGEDLVHHMEEGKRIASAGHQIGNHSFHHNRMIFTSYAQIKHEIETTDSLIRACDYRGEIFFRPPYCKKFITLPYYLYKNNITTITWDVEPETDNVEQNTQTLTARVLSCVKPGSIILMHCMESSRVESRKSLTNIIQELKKQGYTFKTVSELIDITSHN